MYGTGSESSTNQPILWYHFQGDLIWPDISNFFSPGGIGRQQMDDELWRPVHLIGQYFFFI
jgi:hypothetical protein